MFRCSLTLLEMTLHVNTRVITWNTRNVLISVSLLCPTMLSFLSFDFVLTWSRVHFFGGAFVCESCVLL